MRIYFRFNKDSFNRAAAYSAWLNGQHVGNVDISQLTNKWYWYTYFAPPEVPRVNTCDDPVDTAKEAQQQLKDHFRKYLVDKQVD